MPEFNPHKFMTDDLNDTTIVNGGGIFNSMYIEIILFIILIIAIYHLTLEDLIYYYIDGCPYCIELDEKLKQMPLNFTIIKVNLKDNSKNDWRAKPLYYIGKYIFGVKSAPTVYTKHYSQVR